VVLAKLLTGRVRTPAVASAIVHRVIERFIIGLLNTSFSPFIAACRNASEVPARLCRENLNEYLVELCCGGGGVVKGLHEVVD
jgi:hypothetical protein